MSKLLAAVIGVGLSVIAVPSFAHDQAQTQKAVDDIVATYVDRYNHKDAVGVAALYADDGILVPPTSMVTGKANLEKAWQSAFDAGRTDIRYDIKQVQPEGNAVLVVGQFTVAVPEGDRSGNFVNVYQWDGDSLNFACIHSASFHCNAKSGCKLPRSRVVEEAF